MALLEPSKFMSVLLSPALPARGSVLGASFLAPASAGALSFCDVPRWAAQGNLGGLLLRQGCGAVIARHRYPMETAGGQLQRSRDRDSGPRYWEDPTASTELSQMPHRYE
jgi:hypothetical protein